MPEAHQKQVKKKIFPKLKQELKNFLHDEEGIISKDKVIKAGVILSNIIFMSQPAAAHNQTTHSNSLTYPNYSGASVSASHSHHASHSSGQY